MSWAEIKHALNSKLGESDMKALDELIDELASTLANVNNAVATVDNVVDTINTNVNAVKTNTAASTTAAIGGTLSQKLEYIIDTLLGTVNATGGTTTAGSIMAKLNALLTSWTSTRAGYIDNIRSYTLTNNTASKTGVLSQKLAYVIGLLENSSYGLAAIDKHYEPSDTVLSTLIASETYTTIPGNSETEDYKFMYCGSFIPKHSGFVKIKLRWSPTGKDGSTLYGGKRVIILLSNEDMNPCTNNTLESSVSGPINQIRKCCQSLSVGAIGEIDYPVQLVAISSICPYAFELYVADYEEEFVVPVTKGKPIYVVGSSHITSTSGSTIGGPRIYSLTVCGKEVNN